MIENRFLIREICCKNAATLLKIGFVMLEGRIFARVVVTGELFPRIS